MSGLAPNEDRHSAQSMNVRPATRADIPAMFDVRTSVRENHLSLEGLERYGITAASVEQMLESTMGAWVAEDGDRIVAFSMADRVNASVFAMFVRPEYEGRGLGRRLMYETESWLFAHGCEQIWLRTDRDPLVRANGFYQHLGWVSVGVQDDGQVQYIKRRP